MDGTWKGADGLEITIDPYMSTEFGFKKLQMNERLGGTIATGTILMYQGILDLI